MAADTASAERDPGLQPERTNLAWRRTMLATVVADLLIWRGWFLSQARVTPSSFQDSVPTFWWGVCAIAASLATVVLGVCALARRSELRTGTAAVPAAMVRWCAAAVLVLAVACMLTVFLGH